MWEEEVEFGIVRLLLVVLVMDVFLEKIVDFMLVEMGKNLKEVVKMLEDS